MTGFPARSERPLPCLPRIRESSQTVAWQSRHNERLGTFAAQPAN